MPRPQTNARDKILAIADHLFYQYGVRATGVDTIIAQAQVAKTTLYRYFPSKDDLVAAYLDTRNQRFSELLEAAIKPHVDNPRQQLLRVFDWLDDLLDSSDSRGCPFLIVASEFPESSHPGHQIAIAHKQQLRNRLVDLAKAAGIASFESLSDALMVLIDGAFAQRRLYQAHGTRLQPVATKLIDAYLD
ncbi:MAG: TetR/AcrR family transcriptional regulator [Cyanobacteria bacterium P01_F01_bin.3]